MQLTVELDEHFVERPGAKTPYLIDIKPYF
jgi:hypothetical protein